jgi:hypothetical protein
MVTRLTISSETFSLLPVRRRTVFLLCEGQLIKGRAQLFTTDVRYYVNFGVIPLMSSVSRTAIISRTSNCKTNIYEWNLPRVPIIM